MTKETTTVEFGGHEVEVPAGGYYDRFRMNPDLDEVVKDPMVDDVSFCRRIPKRKVQSRVGEAWAPNFYYKTGTVQLVIKAPIAKLQGMLPPPLKALNPFPGFGLIALTFFRYDVCDNDPYNEVSIAILVRPPNATGPDVWNLLKSAREQHFYAHVLALPVTTEIARVRGVEGYQLPKWLAEIDIDIDDEILAAANNPQGELDLGLRVKTPDLTRHRSQTQIGTATSVQPVDGEWKTTTVRTNALTSAQVSFPSNVKLTRGSGPLSDLLTGLGAGRIIQLQVVKDGQMVLDMPMPLEGFGKTK